MLPVAEEFKIPIAPWAPWSSKNNWYTHRKWDTKLFPYILTQSVSDTGEDKAQHSLMERLLSIFNCFRCPLAPVLSHLDTFYHSHSKLLVTWQEWSCEESIILTLWSLYLTMRVSSSAEASACWSGKQLFPHPNYIWLNVLHLFLFHKAAFTTKVSFGHWW